MRQVNKSNVVPLRGAPQGAPSAREQQNAAPTPVSVADVLSQLEQGIGYTKTAAARMVTLVPPGVEADAVQRLLSQYTRVQRQLIDARDDLKSATADSNAQTEALEAASSALAELNSFIEAAEGIIAKQTPSQAMTPATVAKTGTRQRLIFFGAISAAAAVGIGIWAMASKRRRYSGSRTRLKLKAIPE